LDEDAVIQAARETERVCVVEEHAAVGGLSDAVARCLVGRTDRHVRFLTLDIPGLLARHSVGSQSHLKEAAGLVASSIVEALL
jgi:transketolase C-terminal domain/subunit